MDVRNLAELADRIHEHWQPKTIERVNDYDVRLVKVQGQFVWHKHDETDELFYVVDGRLLIELRDREVFLERGELFVVPRGVEHRPRSVVETTVLLLEPTATVNTGDAGGERTVTPEVWH